MLTKSGILSITASIFDPLGLIAPVVIISKIFLQQLWQQNIQWDDQVPEPINSEWMNFYHSLQELNTIRVDRKVIPDQRRCIDIQIHGCADASKRAYGACVYVRSMLDDNSSSVQLLCAKTRVAPIKKLSIPRLELCAAHVLSKLIKNVVSMLPFNLSSINLWTDSTVTLAWIHACPTRWKPFVANRVAEIQDNTPTAVCRHVCTSDNPADILSRGISAQQLDQCTLCWHGPSRLSLPESS